MAGPLTRNINQVGTWDCVACTEAYTSPPEFPLEDSAQAQFCKHCIVAQFDAALKLDFNRPTSWGTRQLDPQDFASILSRKILAELVKKKKEMDALKPQDINGQQRGKDYQNCPRCRKVIHLIDGCNHVTCQCNASFCFRCGKAADGESDHWNAEGCPRYGDAHHPTAEQDEQRRRTERRIVWRQRMLERLREYYGQQGTLDLELSAWIDALQSAAALPEYMRGVGFLSLEAVLAMLDAARGGADEQHPTVVTDPGHGDNPPNNEAVESRTSSTSASGAIETRDAGIDSPPIQNQATLDWINVLDGEFDTRNRATTDWVADLHDGFDAVTIFDALATEDADS